MPGGLCFLYLLASSGIACQFPLHRAISISFAIKRALFVTMFKKKGERAETFFFVFGQSIYTFYSFQ